MSGAASMKKTLLKPIAVSVDVGAYMAGVSRSRFYELMDSGQIPYRMNGSRRLILVADIETWLDRLPIVKPGPKSVGPLLPPEDRALARQRAVTGIVEPSKDEALR